MSAGSFFMIYFLDLLLGNETTEGIPQLLQCEDVNYEYIYKKM